MDDPEGLVDGEGLRIIDVLVVAQMVSVPGPHLLGLPDARRCHDSVVQSGAARPRGQLPLLDNDSTRDDSRRAPLLSLRTAPPAKVPREVAPLSCAVSVDSLVRITSGRWHPLGLA